MREHIWHSANPSPRLEKHNPGSVSDPQFHLVDDMQLHRFLQVYPRCDNAIWGTDNRSSPTATAVSLQGSQPPSASGCPPDRREFQSRCLCLRALCPWPSCQRLQGGPALGQHACGAWTTLAVRANREKSFSFSKCLSILKINTTWAYRKVFIESSQGPRFV